MDEYEMYLSGMSIPEVNKATGIPLSTLRFRFKKKGILRSRGEGIRNALEKGALNPKGNTNPRSDKTRQRISAAKKKLADQKAIGFTYKPSGYMEFTRGPHKGRLVHHVVMEQHIGRQLFPNEVVHHRDGIRANNHISNLKLMSRSEHASLHAKEMYSKRERNSKGQFI